MEPRLIGLFAGILLIVAGALLIGAQLLFGPFDLPNLALHINPAQSARVPANMVGLGAIVAGAILLFASGHAERKPPVRRK